MRYGDYIMNKKPNTIIMDMCMGMTMPMCMAMPVKGDSLMSMKKHCELFVRTVYMDFFKRGYIA